MLNGNKNTCQFANEIVSYIYDEITVSERARFETHLAFCHECTNELAGVSNARLSLFEWHRDEFADLPTPEIVIPYPVRYKVQEESVGFSTGIRGFMSFVSFPASVAAGLIVCVGLGYLFLNYSGSERQSVVSNTNVPTVETTIKPPVVPNVEIQEPEVAVDTGSPDRPAARRIQPAKAVEPRRPKAANKSTVRSPVNKTSEFNVPDAPVLSENHEESADGSPRLSDLFADMDSDS